MTLTQTHHFCVRKVYHLITLICPIIFISHIAQLLLIRKFYCFRKGPHISFKYPRHNQEEIEAFKANVLININHLTRIMTKVLWEINEDDYNNIEQLGSKIATIVKETVNSSSG